MEAQEAVKPQPRAKLRHFRGRNYSVRIRGMSRTQYIRMKLAYHKMMVEKYRSELLISKRRKHNSFYSLQQVELSQCIEKESEKNSEHQKTEERPNGDSETKNDFLRRMYGVDETIKRVNAVDQGPLSLRRRIFLPDFMGEDDLQSYLQSVRSVMGE
ncbi:hypothetical protein EIN_135830 [Entamoeba invadens IP1]|uniref:Uncharacterized protein n=1 Tax=Entamoeba invadens IP1 TaxID=370355 RepID=A0A0A1U329_ENTIV|nr:hypothetical protein EIN_135830 [Entamoeba invadens IP1]ELP85959.1 hypothetical protein EIN_135830 [Entamoeba invadens IP1]|eukprot:XP_004185305.1 hypothetical protein EIN_135830 [Entamoeba invadens IP1]